MIAAGHKNLVEDLPDASGGLRQPVEEAATMLSPH